MNILLFEDDKVRDLYPITIGRAAYGITCAARRLVDWVSKRDANRVSVVRPHLEKIQSLDFPFFAKRLERVHDWTLVLNARVVPSAANFRKLEALIEQSTADSDSSEGVCYRDPAGEMAAALIKTEQLQADDYRELPALAFTAVKSSQRFESAECEINTICHLHDIIRFHQQHLAENLEFQIQSTQWQELTDGLFLGEGAVIGKHVVADTTSGPVVVDRGSMIKPFTYLQGPVYIGPNCTVNEQAALKDGVCLTHSVKAGGEMEASIIEPYSNKQHHGFLGHSYLGSWINIGAGTCNSDLKNTYGTVNMTSGSTKVSTGMQLVGCFMGDYSKTAINTSIFTGKTIGTCSMLYGFVTRNVPSFVNYARTFGQITELPPVVMESTQKRMFGRRQVVQRQADIQLLHDMYDLTQNERGQLPCRSPEF